MKNLTIENNQLIISVKSNKKKNKQKKGLGLFDELFKAQLSKDLKSINQNTKEISSKKGKSEILNSFSLVSKYTYTSKDKNKIQANSEKTNKIIQTFSNQSFASTTSSKEKYNIYIDNLKLKSYKLANFKYIKDYKVAKFSAFETKQLPENKDNKKSEILFKNENAINKNLFLKEKSEKKLLTNIDNIYRKHIINNPLKIEYKVKNLNHVSFVSNSNIEKLSSLIRNPKKIETSKIISLVKRFLLIWQNLGKEISLKNSLDNGKSVKHTGKKINDIQNNNNLNIKLDNNAKVKNLSLIEIRNLAKNKKVFTINKFPFEITKGNFNNYKEKQSYQPIHLSDVKNETIDKLAYKANQKSRVFINKKEFNSEKTTLEKRTILQGDENKTFKNNNQKRIKNHKITIIPLREKSKTFQNIHKFTQDLKKIDFKDKISIRRYEIHSSYKTLQKTNNENNKVDKAKVGKTPPTKNFNKNESKHLEHTNENLYTPNSQGILLTNDIQIQNSLQSSKNKSSKLIKNSVQPVIDNSVKKENIKNTNLNYSQNDKYKESALKNTKNQEKLENKPMSDSKVSTEHITKVDDVINNETNVNLKANMTNYQEPTNIQFFNESTNQQQNQTITLNQNILVINQTKKLNLKKLSGDKIEALKTNKTTNTLKKDIKHNKAFSTQIPEDTKISIKVEASDVNLLDTNNISQNIDSKQILANLNQNNSQENKSNEEKIDLVESTEIKEFSEKLENQEVKKQTTIRQTIEKIENMKKLATKHIFLKLVSKDLVLRANLTNQKLNISMLINEGIYDTFYKDVENIIKETGFEEYSLKIKTQKEVKSFRKPKESISIRA